MSFLLIETRLSLHFVIVGILLGNLPAIATAINFLPAEEIPSDKLSSDETDLSWPDVSIESASADGLTTVGTYIQNGRYESYLYNLESDTSVKIDPEPAAQPERMTDRVSISDNGDFIALSLCAPTSGIFNSDCQSYLYDRKNDIYTPIDTASPQQEFQARGISADGRIVVGKTISQGNEEKAHYYNTATKSLQAIPVESISAKYYNQHAALDIAGDNNTIVGYSYNSRSRKNLGFEAFLAKYDLYDNSRAFLYKIQDGVIKDLGTLKADNSGSAMATAISSDASTVVGYAESDPEGKAAQGIEHAFSYDVEAGKMTDLGDLRKASEATTSRAMAVNKDGSVIVGHSAVNSTVYHAFYYDAKSKKMIDLGTLAGDNPDTASSAAFAISDDGSIVHGISRSSIISPRQVVVWKVNKDASNDSGAPSDTGGLPDSEPPDASKVIMVDVTNSQKTFAQMAEKDHDLQTLTRGQLDGLATMHCALEDKSYCLGVFGTANHARHGGHLLSSGIHGALRLAPQWSAGLSVSYLADENLPDGIDTRGRHTPGVGAYLRYAENPDRSGLNLTASTAWQKQKLAIRRSTIGQTEPGFGDSETKGTLFALDGAYGVKLAEGTLLSPTLGLRYLNTRRDGYRETRDAEFPAIYEKSGEKSTALQVGVGLDHALTPQLSLHADAGTRVVLDRNRDAFTVKAEHIGGFVDHSDKKAHVMPYANAGLSARWGADDASLARLRVGMAKSDYGDSAAHIGVSYDYRF